MICSLQSTDIDAILIKDFKARVGLIFCCDHQGTHAAKCFFFILITPFLKFCFYDFGIIYIDFNAYTLKALESIQYLCFSYEFMVFQWIKQGYTKNIAY